MKFKIAIILILCFPKIYAQSVTLTPSGVLVPSMTTTARTALTATNGQLVYDTTTSSFWYYNGSTWKEISTGSVTNSWTASGNNIYNNNTSNVGIGTTNPINKLDVAGAVAIGSGFAGIVPVPTNGVIIQGQVGIGSGPSNTESNLTIGPNSVTEGGQIQLNPGTGFSKAYHIDNWSDNFRIMSGSNYGSESPRFFINSVGKIGIGTTSPVSKLDVEGGLSVGENYSGTTAAPSNGAIIEGNVGIGTASPAEKLEVNGKTKTTNLQLTNGASNGSILQSDANGNASWVSPSTITNTNWTISGVNQYSTPSGNVGVGTTSPSEKFHLEGGNFLHTGTFGSSPNLTLTGDGTRMFFYPKKAAFRAGFISGANWDDENIGDYSVAMGKSTVAKGENGTAFGSNSIAYGSVSFAAGSYSVAYATNSIAFGNNAIADATDAISIGKRTVARGEGAFSIGNNSNSYNTGSMAFGQDNVSSGVNSLAIGNNTIANNTNSTSLGFATIASGMYALSLGHTSLAAGNYSNAFGFANTSSADFSLTLGNNNYTGGQKSITLGTSLSSSSFAEVVVGANNENSSANSTTDWNADDKIFTVGNGSSPTARSNAFTILKNGNTGIGTSSPSEKLEVNGKTKTNDFQLTNGATNGYILRSDADGNASWASTANIESDPKVGTLTTNFIPKWGGTTLSTGTIFDNGNIGIGTSAPASKLEVQNSSAVDISVKSTGGTAAVNTGSPNATDAGFYLNTIGNNATAIRRWGLEKANNAETGSNTGGYFVLNRYDDNGNYAGQPMMINRTTGTINIGNEGVSTTATTLDIKGSVGVKVKTVVTSNNSTTLNGSDYMVVYGGTITNNTITIPQASTCVGRVYYIINHSSSAVSINNSISYFTANGVVSTSIAAGASVQIVSDSTNWHKIN